MPFRNSVWLSASMGLTAMPSTPEATRLFTISCWDSFVGLAGTRKSKSTSPNDRTAWSQPKRTSDQKSLELLLTNARRNFFLGEEVAAALELLWKLCTKAKIHRARMERRNVFIIRFEKIDFVRFVDLRLCLSSIRVKTSSLITISLPIRSLNLSEANGSG